MTAAGVGPAVFMPSVMISTCFRERGELMTFRVAMLKALPSGVFPLGLEKVRANARSAAASNGPNLTASRALSPLNTNRPASTFRGAPPALPAAKASICFATAVRARLAMTYLGADPPVLSRTASCMLPEVS